MKRIQVIISLLLCTAICANMAFAAQVNESGTISATLQENTEFMSPLETPVNYGATAVNEKSEVGVVDISIIPDSNQANLDIELNGFEYDVNTVGDITQVNFDGKTGYVCVFEGQIIPDDSDSVLKQLTDETGSVSLIADVTFTNTDIFAALTFGVMSGDTKPLIVHYGEYTDSIRNASKTFADSVAQVSQLDAGTNELGATPRVQAGMKFKGNKDIVCGDYTVGELSVFYADELVNQNAMSIYAKVNADTNSMLDYILDTYGYDTTQYGLAAFPDTAYISISGRHVDLHATPNGYTPQNNVTTFTVPIYFYEESIGLQSISVDVEVARTTVTPSSYGNSVYSNNTLEWEIYDGGGLDNMSGDYTTKTGMGVEAYYAMESDNVTSYFYAPLRFTGALRYYYTLVELELGGLGDIYNYHIKSDTASMSKTVKILPS